MLNRHDEKLEEKVKKKVSSADLGYMVRFILNNSYSEFDSIRQ